MLSLPKASFVQVAEEAILRSLNNQIAYAKEKSPFYRDTLSATRELPSLSALAALPFTTAAQLRDFGTRMVCVPGSEVARIVSLPSSGTTGEAKRIYFTEGDLGRTVDFFAEGMAWMCGKGDRVGIFMPGASPNGISDLLARGLREIGALPLHYGLISDMGELIPRLESEKPTVLVGLPWQMRSLSLAMPELRPETVLLSADYTPNGLPQFLEKQWGCRVLEHFGMTETGYGCAVEHPEHRGMFLRCDEFIAEIVHPESGEVLPIGETGELVLTTLRREAMPLIRYRTGDYARMLDGGRIERVCGRIALPRGQYALQDRLCPLPWLYEFRAKDNGISAIVGSDAPKNCREELMRLSDMENSEIIVLPSAREMGISARKREI